MPAQAKKAVLIIGLIPELVDFSTMPGLNAEKVRAGLTAEHARVAEAGFEPDQLLIDMGETAEAVIRAKARLQHEPDRFARRYPALDGLAGRLSSRS